jgi:D-alanyl-D-alanine carboxypeptidase-like protein
VKSARLRGAVGAVRGRFLGNLARDVERLKFVGKGLAGTWSAIAVDFEDAYPGSYVTITKDGGYRTPAQQALAKREGASSFDGKKKFSKHQAWPAMALDFAVIAPASETRWKATKGYVTDGLDARYAFVGRSFEKAGFTWGGRWHAKGSKPDYDHVEKRGHGPSKIDVANGFAEYSQLTKRGKRSTDAQAIAV